MIRLVSWDVDGTLFSYGRLLAALISLSPRKFRQCGVVRTGREIRDTCSFHRIVEAQRRSPDSRVVESDLVPFAATYAREKEALEAALQRMRPGKRVLQALDSYAAAGLIQVALSDFECAYKLRALGIERYFTALYSCRELGFWKPSPLPLEHIQRIHGVRPDEHLHIGDRADADGEACARNGCQSANPSMCPLPGSY